MSSAAPAVDPVLARLQALYNLKELLDREGPVNVTPFTEDRVVCYETDISGFDVPAIHQTQRDLLHKALAEVHEQQTARVVLLSGNPGMGKSHLIRYFAQPELAATHRYIFVRPGNDWRIAEFEECLLDSLLAALVHPSPAGPNLLMERIEDIAFTALGHLLEQPGGLAEFRPRSGRGRLRRFLDRLFRSYRQHLTRLHGERSSAVFRRLDFDAFSAYVCDRFLDEPGHPLHRHILRVLLCALFPEERQHVVNWLSRRLAGDHFARKLGVEARLDGAYQRMAAIRLLVSLFSREVSSGLRNARDEPLASQVFFFVFDQTEGRDELFESEADWFTFFGYLSELYNSLPNVFILFTMSLGLRDQLHARMEKQFQDRIRRDERFVLHDIEPAETLDLYRRRLERWLGPGQETLRRTMEECGNPYLPFDQARVLEMAETKTLRDMLEEFDTRFREILLNFASGVERDYRLWLRELKEGETGDPYKDTEDHQETVVQLLNLYGESMAARVGIGLQKVEVVTTEQGGYEVLLLNFLDPEDESRWVRAYQGRVSYQFNAKAKASVKLLFYKQRPRYSLWLVRPISFVFEVPPDRESQVYCREIPPDQETSLKAVIKVLEKKDEYPPEEWKKGEELLANVVQGTYMGELFQQAAASLKALSGTSEDAAEESAVAAEDEETP
jgi:hypothetical protein